MSLLGTAGLFLFAGAQFLAVATVVVYAGAILVTFLFVLMLAQPEGKAPYDRVSWEALLSAAAGVVMVGVLSMTIGGVLSPAGRPRIGDRFRRRTKPWPRGVLAPQHVARLGGELFGRHLIAVEVAGTLLLAALVGAAVIVAQGQRTGGTNAIGRRARLDGSTAMPHEIALLNNYLIVGAMLFGIGTDRLPEPAEHDRHVPLGRDHAARRVAEPGGLEPVSQRFRRPDAGDVHHCRGGLRGGHRPGPGR